MASSVANLESLTKLFGNLFLGSGKQTSTTNADPNAIAALTGISQNALSRANDKTATDDLVSSIIRKNAIAFAPISAMQKSAGMYNSVTLRQLSNEAQANSTADASKAVLDYQTNNLQLAANANAALLNASKTTTTQTPSMLPPGLGLALGGGLLGYSLYKKKDDIKDFFERTFGNKNAIEGAEASQTADFSDVDSFQTGGGGAFENSSSVGANAAQQAPIAAGNSSSATVDAWADDGGSASPIVTADAVFDTGLETSAGDIAGTAGDFSDLDSFASNFSATDSANFAKESFDAAQAADATAGATDALTGVDPNSLTDAFDNVDFFAPGDAVAGAGDAISGITDSVSNFASDAFDAITDFGPSPLSVVSAGAHLAQGDVLGAVLSFIPGGNIIRSVVSGGSIICTELRKQDRLSRKHYIASLKHFKNYKQVSRDAYYIWAGPCVKHLRARPSSMFSKILEKIFRERSKFICREGNTVSGAVSYAVVSMASIICGVTILPFRNWKRKRYLTNIVGAVQCQ